MSANIITNLLWFAGIGGLFYLMMRGGGCGGHRHGGAGEHEHGGREGDAHRDELGHSSGAHAGPSAPAQAPPVDPVCGMPVARTSTALARSYMGQTFHFCSQDCLQEFDADPPKYARTPGSAEHPRRAHRC